METIAEGQLEMPRSIPSSAVPIMPKRMPPLTFRAIRIKVSTRPKHAVCTSRSAEEAAQAYKSGRIGHHQFGVAQSDEGDEEADAGGGGMLEAIGSMPLTICSRTRVTVSNRKTTPEKKLTTPWARCAHGDVHAQANRVGEVGVERHSRRQRDGIVGVNSHHQRGDLRAERQVAKTTPSREHSRPGPLRFAGSPRRCMPW